MLEIHPRYKMNTKGKLLSINPKTSENPETGFSQLKWIYSFLDSRLVSKTVFAMFLDLLCSFALHFSYVSPATHFTTIRQPPPSIENEASVASILSTAVAVLLGIPTFTSALSSAAQHASKEAEEIKERERSCTDRHLACRCGSVAEADH